MVTYNQNRFVADAIDGLFAQDCGPLEILLSDDCSTDGTFDIVEQKAAAYAGPHIVRVNRNPRNLGLMAHYNRVVELAAHPIMILAAGDDISLPHRAGRIIEAFAAHTPLLVHSRVLPIDDTGQACVFNYDPSELFRPIDPLERAGSRMMYLGAGGAWSRELFDTYGPLPTDHAIEDQVLGFRAALEGRIHFIDEPLLKYRVGVGLSSKPPRAGSIAEIRAQRVRSQAEGRDVFDARLLDARRFGLSEDDPIIRRLTRCSVEARARLGVLQAPEELPALAVRHPGITLKAGISEALHLLRRR